ncbi:MAG: nickel-dependent hydrogenase large subunit, partial [Vicinamibacterales bacterium]
MAWDPITRIVGSLGIYTKIDFERREVAECYSTSSIFRGYSIFMKGKDPRDAHFITSRICGICGDNHATCSCYAQNMAYAVRPPALAEWIINLGEAAEFMFDHNIFQENLVGVDFCEKMVRETNPGVWEKAQNTACRHASAHGYRTIADIMRSLNPFEGEFYREALQMSRMTREMFCLMEGRHVHPSTLYPGGVGTPATIQTFTDYLVRLMKYVEFMKKVVPMHDDLFDFFYEALPGYEKVGQRRVLLGCWGAFQDPEYCNFEYRDMTEWGRRMFVTPGVVVDGKLVTTDLVEINLGIRILLGSSYYDDWTDQKMYVNEDPLGNPVDRRHPWNQHTIPRPQKRDFDGGRYTWVMSPRWFDGKDFLALDTGGGPLARLWATALAGMVNIGYVKATG